MLDHRKQHILADVAKELFRKRGIEMTDEDKRVIMQYSKVVAEEFGYDSAYDHLELYGDEETLAEPRVVDIEAILEEVGLGVITMSKDEMAELVEVMGEAQFRKILGELARYIKSTGYRIKSQRETMLKWYNRSMAEAREGRRISGKYAQNSAIEKEGSATSSSPENASNDALKSPENGSQNTSANGLISPENASVSALKSPYKRSEAPKRKPLAPSPRFEESNRIVPGYQIKYMAALLRTHVPLIKYSVDE